jgi:hypothetical protein
MAKFKLLNPRSLAAQQSTLLSSGMAQASRVKEIAYSEVPTKALVRARN